jgi:hypothetical protein
MNLLRRLFEREIALVRRTFKRRRGFRRQSSSQAPDQGRNSTLKPDALPGALNRSLHAASNPGTLPQRPAPGSPTEGPPSAALRGLPVTRRRVRALKPALLGAAVSATFHVAIIALLLQFKPAEPPAAHREAVLVTIRLRTPKTELPRKPPPIRLSQTKPKTIEIEEPVLEISRPTPVKVDESPAPDPRDTETEAALGSGDLTAPRLRRTNSLSEPVIGVGAQAAPSRHGLEGALLSSRGQGRATALERYGGSLGTEDAVSRGLFWLAAHQEDDGTWDADGFQHHCKSYTQCFGKGKPRFNIGVTALATLAFLGAGHSPGKPSVFSDVVRKALNSLLATQTGDGKFGPMFDEFFYNHAVATLAMVEAYGIQRDPRYLQSASRALAFSAKGQQAGGAWDYTPEKTGRHDLSITGWQIMAIRAAQELDIPFEKSMLNGIRAYLPTCVQPDGAALYANRGIAEGRKGINMVAVGMLSQLYAGVPSRARSIQLARDRILINPPDIEKTYDWLRYFQSSYYWYTATLAIFQLGGKEWEAWNHFLQQTVLPLQNREPHEDGSWEPDGNWLGVMGGRIVSTALNVLTLEVYYRYRPLHAYKKPPQADQ